MPRQNRVTPRGDVIVTPARGTLTGNRGCLHDPAGRICRPYQVARWIVCLLEFRGRHRTVMTPGRYTELFFLDEATALAAGHRPCAECQRERFNLFRTHWTGANPELAGSPSPAAPVLDAALHRERLTASRQKRTYAETLSRLPSGAFVVLGDAPHLVYGEHLLPWYPEGYGPPITRPAAAQVAVLTPRSTVRALRHGYPAGVHPSAPGLR